jgi:hypothetical protein
MTTKPANAELPGEQRLTITDAGRAALREFGE